MTDSATVQVHGTCVAWGGRAVLLRGASGTGKSDLALRMIEEGARLVADDRVDLAVRDGELTVSAPAPLAGLIEVRGLGIVRMPPDRIAVRAVLVLVADLAPGEGAVERLPEPETVEILGVPVARVRLAPFAASAPARLRLAAGLGPGSIIPTQ